MKKVILFAFAAAALAAPGAALASGVVLKVQPARHLVAIARTPTRVSIVHTSAASRLHVGQRVSLQARLLRNGTFAATKVAVVGHSHTVRFRALLLARRSGHIVVSAGGAVISLKQAASRTTSSARDSGSPAPGSQVVVTATVSDDELEADTVTVFSPTSPGGRVEGTLSIGTGTIAVTSEQMSLVIKLPTGFDLTAFRTGDKVLAEFAQQPDGSLLLTKLSGDENVQEADDNSDGGTAGGGDGGSGGGGDGSHGGDGGGDG